MGLGEMAEIAARYDTSMSRAMLRALASLGVGPARRHRRDWGRGTRMRPSAPSRGELRECMRQTHGVEGL